MREHARRARRFPIKSTLLLGAVLGFCLLTIKEQFARADRERIALAKIARHCHPLPPWLEGHVVVSAECEAAEKRYAAVKKAHGASRLWTLTALRGADGL